MYRAHVYFDYLHLCVFAEYCDVWLMFTECWKTHWQKSFSMNKHVKVHHLLGHTRTGKRIWERKWQEREKRRRGVEVSHGCPHQSHPSRGHSEPLTPSTLFQSRPPQAHYPRDGRICGGPAGLPSLLLLPRDNTSAIRFVPQQSRQRYQDPTKCRYSTVNGGRVQSRAAVSVHDVRTAGVLKT